jgi:transmembrane sensor
VFDNTPLSEAVRQLYRYHQTRISLADSTIARLPITGTLSATEPMEFLRMIQTVFGLHEQRANGAIVISR